jgi:hypothetical protein
MVQILPYCHNPFFSRCFDYACIYGTLQKLGEANGEFRGATRLSKYSKKALGSLIGRQCADRIRWQVRKVGPR